MFFCLGCAVHESTGESNTCVAMVRPVNLLINFSYQLSMPNIYMSSLRNLYKLVNFDSNNVAHDSCADAWDLRKLYTFAWRRKLDAFKRKQFGE